MADAVYMGDHRSEGGWGVEPDDLSLMIKRGDEKLTISWSVESKTQVNGQTICEVAGVIVKRRMDRIPKDENDGTTILKSEDCSGKYVDTGLTNGETYYYNAFPYSRHKVYNRNCAGVSAAPQHMSTIAIQFSSNAANGYTLTATNGSSKETAEVKPLAAGKGGVAEFAVTETGVWNVAGVDVTVSEIGESITVHAHVFGFDWIIPPQEADTESQISYPEDVDNASYSGVAALGSDAEINVGADWQGYFDDFVKARPVMLNFDGTVAAELDHSDQTKNLDGTASKVADSSTTQNAMVEFPKRYFYRSLSKNSAGQTIGCVRQSEFKLSDDWHCDPWLYGNSYDDAVENDVIYLPMFEGSSISSKLRSLSGKTPINTQTGSTEITQAKACGDGWYIDDFADFMMISDMMMMVGKSTDVQKHWGYGHYSGGSQASHLHTTGSLVSKGPFYGGTGNTNMKFLWMENWYGDRWERTAGCETLNSLIYIKNFPPYTSGTTENMISTGHYMSGTPGGYMSAVVFGSYGWTPSVVSGAEGKYIPDGAWFANNCYLLRGAPCVDGAKVGLAVSLPNPLSYSNWSIGASPSYKKPHAATAA